MSACLGGFAFLDTGPLVLILTKGHRYLELLLSLSNCYGDASAIGSEGKCENATPLPLQPLLAVCWFTREMIVGNCFGAFILFKQIENMQTGQEGERIL